MQIFSTILRVLLLCTLLLAAMITMNGQSLDRHITAAAGNTGTLQGIQIDFTIGECMTIPVGNNNILLTQGFQQPFTYVLRADAIFPFIRMYPNPTQGNTILHFALPAPGNLQVTVYSAIGHRLLYETIHYASGETQYIIKTAALLPGTYMVNVQLEGYGTVNKKLIRVER